MKNFFGWLLAAATSLSLSFAYADDKTSKKKEEQVSESEESSYNDSSNEGMATVFDNNAADFDNDGTEEGDE